MKGWFRKKIVLGQCSVHKDAEMQRVMWVLKECKYFSQEDGFLYKSCL